MAFGPVSLPQFRAPEPLDFRGLNEGLDVMRENMRRNKLLEEAKAVGAATYGGAPDGNVSPQPAPMQPNRLLSSSSPAQYQGSGVVDRIIGAESGGRANATNPRSSATGAGQFISSTWLDTIKRARPDLASGKSDADLLAMRNDGNLSREMTAAYADQNGKALQSAGFDATPGNTYLAHFAGPAGARSVLSADPATPLTRILSPDAIRANPHIANMTAGDLKSWAERKMGGGQPQQPSAPTPQASGPNYDAGIRLAYSQGNTALAMQLQQQKQEAENTSYTRQRQSVQDAQAAETHGLSVEEAQNKLQKNFVTTVGAAAQIIANEQDPAKKAAMWQTMVSSDPRFARSLQRYGVDPSDVNAGTQMLIAEARGAMEATKPIEVGGNLVLKQPDGSYKAVYTGPAKRGDVPSGYRLTADGNGLEFIPGGPADPALKPKGRDKYTELQSKAANFGNMMTEAEKQLLATAPLDANKQPDVTKIENPKNVFGALRDGLMPFEGLRNTVTPSDTQAYNQLAKQWIRAKLRKESGAAIGTDEMDQEFRTYFPQYGDGPEVLKQKALARAEATKGMIAESGGAYADLFQQGAAQPPKESPAPRLTTQRPAGKSNDQLLMDAKRAVDSGADEREVLKQLEQWGVSLGG